ncbi:hypothetical protein ACS0TY_008643 [Phlomoides rotata]
MRAISISFSATLVPQILCDDVNTRCVSVPVIKSQLQPTRRRSFTTRIPSLSGTATEGRNVQSPTSVPVRVANELLQAGHRYLDVRVLLELRTWQGDTLLGFKMDFHPQSDNQRMKENTQCIFENLMEYITI